MGAGDCVSTSPAVRSTRSATARGVVLKNSDTVSVGQRGWLSIASATYGWVSNAASTTTRLPLPQASSAG